MATCFLDCEFTNLVHSELLTIGMFEFARAEHCLELDLDSDIGQTRVKTSSDFVQYGGVLNLWGLDFVGDPGGVDMLEGYLGRIGNG